VWIGVVPSSARHSPTASTLPADLSVRNKTVALRMLDPVLRECERLPVARVVLPECQLRVVAGVCRKSHRCTGLGSLVIA